MRQHFAVLFMAFVVFALIGAGPAVAQKSDATNDMSWLDGFTLVTLDTDDVSGLHNARAAIQAHGGSVAIMSLPSTILGWVPFDRRAELIGQAGIKDIYYSEVLKGEVDVSDLDTRLMVNYFNAVVRGEIQEKMFEEVAKVEAENRKPLPNDTREHPMVDEADYLRNLEAAGLNINDLKNRGLLIDQTPGAIAGNSDYLNSTIAVTLFMVESNGSIDPDDYTWTEEHMQQYVNDVNTGLAWWTSVAPNYFDCWCAFFVRYYPGTDSRCQQGYEPVTRGSNYANTWVNTVITNFGYTVGNVFAKVTSYNTAQKALYGTDWAFSGFIAYNPSPSPNQFTDGAAAWAYLGGPFTVQLFRSYTWNPSQVFTHETGHIFYACDEYASSGCGCNCTRAIGTELNNNCENCTAGGACMMNTNTFGLCQWTPAQIGWKSAGCAPSPLAAPTASVVAPDDELQGLTTTITVTGTNLLYGATVDMGSDVAVNYTNYINSTTFEANITIDNDAAIGLRDVTVLNRDLQSAVITNGFEVKQTTRHYASPTGGDVFPYVTPADAAQVLTDAIDAAGAGDSILVESATYSGMNLSIGQGVKMYGAYNSTFTARDLTTGKTEFLLAGNVTFGPGAPGDCALDGFELHGGTGAGQTAPIPGTYGGAVRVLSSTATIANCEIYDSQVGDGFGAYGAGGGIYASGGAIYVVNTEIRDCTAVQGGAIFLDGCTGSITGSNIHDNNLLYGGTQPANGGGIYIVNSSLISMSLNTIDTNIADPASGSGFTGGGVYLKNNTSVAMNGDVVSNNQAGVSGGTGNGGGIHCEATGLTMTNVTITGNSAKIIGGGLDADGVSTVSMTDSEVSLNTALIGGGMYLASSETHINYNLFANNSGTGCYILSPSAGSFIGNTMNGNSGGGVNMTNAGIPVINNIVTNTTGAGMACTGSPIPTPTYCNVWNSSTADYSGCTPGAGCISLDPLYVDAVSGDYHLTIHSPCIDTGDPNPSYNDLDGSRGDMGMYNSPNFPMDQPEFVKNLVATIDAGDVILKWNSNPEPDVAQYAVYKSASPDFVPDAGTFVNVVAAPDTTYDDGPSVSGTYYKVNAIDATDYAGGYGGPAEAGGTGIGDEIARYDFNLRQNHPNPFNPTTRIRYELNSRVHVSLSVFDVQGRKIKQLVNEVKTPGQYTAEWNGTNADGSRVSTGVYFYRIEAGSFVQTKKMVMLK